MKWECDVITSTPAADISRSYIKEVFRSPEAQKSKQSHGRLCEARFAIRRYRDGANITEKGKG